MKKHLIKISSVLLLVSLVLFTNNFVIAKESFPDLQSFYRSTLTSSLSSVSTTVNVSTAPSIDTGLFVIEPRTSNQEIVYMTSRSGTQLTVVRGLGTYGINLTASTTNIAHPAGSGIENADVHYYVKLLQSSLPMSLRGATTSTAFTGLLNPEKFDLIFSTSTERWYANDGTNWIKQGDNTETIGGIKTFSQPMILAQGLTVTGTSTLTSGALVSTAYRCGTGSDNNQLCDKAYIDSVAVAGASNANTTTKGIVEEATVAEINSASLTGGTGARLFMTPQSYSYSNFASSSIVTTIIPQSLLWFNGITTVSGGVDLASTTAHVGIVNFTHRIDVNTINVFMGQCGAGGANQLGVGLYDMSGVKIMSTTTSPFCSSANGFGFTVPATFSPSVSISPGNYYLLVAPKNIALSTKLYGWKTDGGVANGGSIQVSGLKKIEGTYTIPDGVLPTSITPSGIATSGSSNTPIVRFDN